MTSVYKDDKSHAPVTQSAAAVAPSLPSAFRSKATHFTPIILSQMGTPPVTAPANENAPLVPTKDKIVAKKMKELKKNLMKNRLPISLVDDIEKDADCDGDQSQSGESVTSPTVTQSNPPPIKPKPILRKATSLPVNTMVTKPLLCGPSLNQEASIPQNSAQPDSAKLDEYHGLKSISSSIQDVSANQSYICHTTIQGQAQGHPSAGLDYQGGQKGQMFVEGQGQFQGQPVGVSHQDGNGLSVDNNSVQRQMQGHQPASAISQGTPNQGAPPGQFQGPPPGVQFLSQQPFSLPIQISPAGASGIVQNIQVQLQQDPRTGLFHVIPVGMPAAPGTTQAPKGVPAALDSNHEPKGGSVLSVNDNVPIIKPRTPRGANAELSSSTESERVLIGPAQRQNSLEKVLNSKDGEKHNQSVNTKTTEKVDMYEPVKSPRSRSSEKGRSPEKPERKKRPSISSSSDIGKNAKKTQVGSSSMLNNGDVVQNVEKIDNQRELVSITAVPGYDENSYHSPNRDNTFSRRRASKDSNKSRNENASENKAMLKKTISGSSVSVSATEFNQESALESENTSQEPENVHIPTKTDSHQKQVENGKQDINWSKPMSKLIDDGVKQDEDEQVESKALGGDLSLPPEAPSSDLHPQPGSRSPSDSGVSGLNGQASANNGEISLMDRFLSGEAVRRHAELGKIIHLIREEFAFDGYLENGIEDVAMGKYSCYWSIQQEPGVGFARYVYPRSLFSCKFSFTKKKWCS